MSQNIRNCCLLYQMLRPRNHKSAEKQLYFIDGRKNTLECAHRRECHRTESPRQKISSFFFTSVIVRYGFSLRWVKKQYMNELNDQKM